MTGPSESVIGVETEIVIRKFLTGMPERFETAKLHPQLQGVVVEIDPGSGQALGIERISLPAPRRRPARRSPPAAASRRGTRVIRRGAVRRFPLRASGRRRYYSQPDRQITGSRRTNGLPEAHFLFFGREAAMSKRQQVEAAVESIAAPILAALGLEIVEVALTGPGARARRCA